SRLSNVQTNAASSSCPNAGSSSEHLLGLGDAAGLPRTGSVSIKKRSHSLSSPLSASCSENYAIQCDLSGQTLTERFLMRFRRWPRPTPFEDTSRKRAAFFRKQRLEREALPLFADHIAAQQRDVEDEMRRRAEHWSMSQRDWRDQRA